MRILFFSMPAVGHFFPLVPLAQAARATGHEVLMGSCGEAAALAEAAALPMADVAPGVTLKSLFTDFHRRYREVNERIIAGARSEDLEGVHFGTFSDWLADGAISVAEKWRPDLVVYERMAPFGLLAAKVLGVPAVRHDLGISPGERAGQLRHLAAALQRHGVQELIDDGPWLDIAPPSMTGGRRGGWLMRPVFPAGSGKLPSWLRLESRRALIAVTLGTIVPRMQGIGVAQQILALAPEVDADFVLTLEPRDRQKLGALPENVRDGGWLPMGPLLAACTAVVHHGGSGTMFAALDAGVPQLIVPGGTSDRQVNADAIAARGAGLACAPDVLDASLLQRIVADRNLRTAAQEVSAELSGMPAPSEVVQRFEELVG
ncbi:glycosyltransferase [Amycolatopsis circi]|uniref:glycosyltransferase n=1 Tax=Amycolatopsis circi TaxID=871959 RepID=UPI000E232890|nr:glycosyltransferase [Amycolatopsis circi]